MRVRQPKAWPTWPILAPHVEAAQKRLEIGAGVMPKFSIPGTYFLDTSASAIEKLKEEGGEGVVLDAGHALPFKNEFFDLIGAFEVLEHIEQPETTLQEVNRILRTGGKFLLSVPIHHKYWSQWDEFAGHVQRFEPKQLGKLLIKQGFTIERCYLFRRATQLPFSAYAHSLGCTIICHLPRAPYFWDACLYCYTLLARIFLRPRAYSFLHEIPSNGLALLVICTKR